MALLVGPVRPAPVHTRLARTDDHRHRRGLALWTVGRRPLAVENPGTRIKEAAERAELHHVTQLGHLTRLVGVLVCLVASPIALVWPRPVARLLVPSRAARARIATRPAPWAWLLGGTLSIGATVATADWMFGGMGLGDAAHPAQLVGLLAVIFGGPTLAAFHRVVRVGAREWAVTYAVVPRLPTSVPAARPLPPSYSGPKTSPPVGQPPVHDVGRRLRSTARWLGATGLAWYLFGRVLQAASLGRRGGSEVPNWWWAGTAVLVVAGGAVWLGRRHLRWSHARAAAPDADPADVLEAWGFQVSRPGGEGVRSFAPESFRASSEIAGPSVWPWVAVGALGTRTLVVARQTGQVRNRTGLTWSRTRTVFAVRVPGASLPTVIVTGRESVPPASLPMSIDLELATFNRSLWAWGPDPRGFHDVLHPRAMEPILRDLPEGATVRFDRDRIAVYNDEPVRSDDLATYLGLMHQLADLLPRYLVQR
jgi:hypothetical protein